MSFHPVYLLAAVTCVTLWPGCIFDKSGLPNDDGNSNNQGRCGNGMIEGGETCDDRNQTAGDGCADDCTAEAGWVCLGEPSRCNFTCGDGVIDAGELCDDANLDEDDGCSASCQVQPGWDCGAEPSVCIPVCGDGIVVAAEGCDDGNAAAGDGCTGDCSSEAGWDCTGEPSVCAPICGDGQILGPEGCDDGDVNPGDGCSTTCDAETGWLCTGEPSLCQSICGDGIVVSGEGCDDGNVSGGDGCAGDCNPEAFFSCTGQPSTCVCTVYVDVAQVANQPDGGSWTSAFPRVQDGIDLAEALGGGCEVWVAQGSYFIYETSTVDTVNLRSGVHVYGGFNGTEIQRSQRDWTLNVTVLDGENPGNPSQEVDRVVRADQVIGPVLDGFTIRRADGGNAGGLYAFQSTLTVRNCLFENNRASSGGGIYASDSNTTVESCSFEVNTATGGGGAIRVFQGSLNVSNSIFQGNTATGSGGAIYASDAALEILSSQFLQNQSNTHGGGAYIFDCPTNIEDSVFQGNRADNGAGVYVHLETIDVLRTDFVGNDADILGGGMRILDALATVADCIFDDNSADNGGATHASGGNATVTITGCTMNQNTGRDRGGGLYFNADPVVVRDTVLSENTAGLDGGGMYVLSNPVAVTNAIFVANQAERGGGAFHQSIGSGLSYSGCTFIDNTATDSPAGDGIESSSTSNATIANSILRGNLPAQIHSVSSTVSVRYCNIEGGATGPGNIDQNPLFVSPVTWDFHLLAGSPCIDAGDGDLAWAQDLEGNPRVDDLAVPNNGTGAPPFVDIGAYEYQP